MHDFDIFRLTYYHALIGMILLLSSAGDNTFSAVVDPRIRTDDGPNHTSESAS
jgi:hypothetical protein